MSEVNVNDSADGDLWRQQKNAWACSYVSAMRLSARNAESYPSIVIWNLWINLYKPTDDTIWTWGLSWSEIA